MAITAVIFSWKLLFWVPVVLLDSSKNATSSSSFPSSWLHHDERNLDFDYQSTNDTGISSTNVADERFQGNFSSNEEIASGNVEQEASSDNKYHDYDEAEEFIIPSVENYTKSTKSSMVYHSYRRSLKNMKRCIRYSEKYLYQSLERAGMLNQWFMANNPEEAGRNFARSHENFFQTKFDYFDLPQYDSLVSDIEDSDILFSCNGLCQNIISKLNEALAKEKNDTFLLSVPFLDDTQSHIINVNSTKSTLTSCQLGMFIPVGNCIPQGAEEFQKHSKLCTSCHGVYMLGKMCFPRFINAIKCESQTSGCIFDKFSTQAHGSCYMHTLTFKVLHNKGSEECQEWQYEYIQVPTSCECQLDVESLLLSAVKP